MNERYMALFSEITRLVAACPVDRPGFRADLIALARDAGVEYQGSARMLHEVSDILSGTENSEILGGTWLVTEVEVNDVQFNRLIGAIGQFAPTKRVRVRSSNLAL